ncbi:MAG TPA: glycosyltransferase family A protein [Pyrinomonadaceae bacterium]|nr:glycosyltransferase family A protein [Pyrinomonadaceae bacterium]
MSTSSSINHPLVSVIIPAYKVAPYLAESLESVFAQTFSDFEVILVNDGSPDTGEMEKVIEPYRDRIVYLRQENRGAGAARNTGLGSARGRYVAFLDGDDIWLPNFLSEMVSFIESDGGYDLVYANALLFGVSQVAGLTYMDTNPSSGEVTCESLLAERCNIITSGVLARKEPIVELGMFDEALRNSQDFDMWVRIAKRPGARLSFLPTVLLKQRHRPGSLASDSIKSVEGELRVMAKMALRDDLTEAERAAMERTVAHRTTTLEVDRCKLKLREGDFAAARRSFQQVFDRERSTKNRLVLLWLRLSPRTLQRFYRAARPGENRSKA